jgi:hypothetical protein
MAWHGDNTRPIGADSASLGEDADKPFKARNDVHTKVHAIALPFAPSEH